MESSALTKYQRISAKKTRLMADAIRGYSFPEAVDVLKAVPKKSSQVILKTLYSAGANAKYKKPDILEKDLFIKKICVDEGPTMKRFKARARGRASRIRKRTSNIMIILSDES